MYYCLHTHTHIRTPCMHIFLDAHRTCLFTLVFFLLLLRLLIVNSLSPYNTREDIMKWIRVCVARWHVQAFCTVRNTLDQCESFIWFGHTSIVDYVMCVCARESALGGRNSSNNRIICELMWFVSVYIQYFSFSMLLFFSICAEQTRRKRIQHTEYQFICVARMANRRHSFNVPFICRPTERMIWRVTFCCTNDIIRALTSLIAASRHRDTVCTTLACRMHRHTAQCTWNTLWHAEKRKMHARMHCRCGKNCTVSCRKRYLISCDRGHKRRILFFLQLVFRVQKILLNWNSIESRPIFHFCTLTEVLTHFGTKSIHPAPREARLWQSSNANYHFIDR